MKLFEVKLRICEQPAYRYTGILIFIGLQLFFLSFFLSFVATATEEKPSFPLKPLCHSRKTSLILNNFISKITILPLTHHYFPKKNSCRFFLDLSILYLQFI
jgi:hypothetical protein